MKERPILFSAPMVRALLDGRKTQTRRPYKIRKHPDAGCEIAASELVREQQHVIDRTCSYGQPGDRLWVRENGWERPERTPKMMREGADTWEPYYFDADGWSDVDHEQFKEWGFKRRPSIHMPRWASRILLEVVSVRVERLQDISEADAIAEGIEPNWIGDLKTGPNGFGGQGWVPDCGWRHYGNSIDGDPAYTAVESYRSLWESINGASSWDANPWVWVVEFKSATDLTKANG